MNVTGWQGGGSVVDPLEKVGPGVYRTTKPIPVYGGWKSTLRIQQGDALVSMPLFMPKDEAIPAPEVPAKANFTRDFQSDKSVLQREAKQGVSPALTLGAYLTVLAIALSLIALIAWSLLRIDRGGRASLATALEGLRPARPNSCETALKEPATAAECSDSFTRHAESAHSAERGNQVVGGHGHWGESPLEEKRKLFQREPVS